MIVFRLTKAKFKNELSGFGSNKYGGRWNSKGIEVIYTSQSRALCLAEIIVHFDISKVPREYFLMEIWIPDLSIYHFPQNNLPNGWNSFPYNPMTRKIGNQFIQNHEFLVLRLPSSVVLGDFNFLINPYHPDFHKVKIVSNKAFPIDSRLLFPSR